MQPKMTKLLQELSDSFDIEDDVVELITEAYKHDMNLLLEHISTTFMREVNVEYELKKQGLYNSSE